MSYYEYKDLFNLAQRSGKYRMYVIDLKDSRSIEDLQTAENKLKEKIQIITNFIESELGILHNVNHPLYQNNNYFQIGDLCGFVTLSGYNKLVEMIINEEFKDFEYPYHYATGLYDTDDWVKGNKQYYFGYCIQQLEENSKISDLER